MTRWPASLVTEVWLKTLLILVNSTKLMNAWRHLFFCDIRPTRGYGWCVPRWVKPLHSLCSWSLYLVCRHWLSVYRINIHSDVMHNNILVRDGLHIWGPIKLSLQLYRSHLDLLVFPYLHVWDLSLLLNDSWVYLEKKHHPIPINA